mmetsp:Transcript_21387/g.49769  ORF Transcript_21387/g.49769 Transcript_21387/m.49769 type:complete len:578 (+) Transcript_21387:46-1779(+)
MPTSAAMRAGSADIRQSFERRRREQFEKFTNALAEVDPTDFMREDASMNSGGICCLDLQLSGAIPPITESRRVDSAGVAAIAVSEKRAAEELIAKSRQESLLAKQAMVTQARRTRSGIRLQSLRPVSMQSTRDNSPLPQPPSPLSANSDWEPFVAGTSPDPTTSPRAPGTRGSHSELESPIPIGKVFEEMLANYYRQAEQIRDVQYAAVQRARQQETEAAQREHVHREHFEMKHRRREFAIIHELHRRERRRVFDESRSVLVVDRLAEARLKIKLEQQRRREAVRQQRAQSIAKRAKYESHFDFILSRGALERACSKTDRDKHRKKQLAETKMQVDTRKDKWANHAGHLHARQVFLKEQKRVREEDEDRQHRYYMARQNALLEQENLDKQLNVKMHHACSNAIRDMMKQMDPSIVHSEDSQPPVTWSTASVRSIPSLVVEDAASYQEALQAISSLTDAVRAQMPLRRQRASTRPSRSSEAPTRPKGVKRGDGLEGTRTERAKLSAESAVPAEPAKLAKPKVDEPEPDIEDAEPDELDDMQDMEDAEESDVTGDEEEEEENANVEDSDEPVSEASARF